MSFLARNLNICMHVVLICKFNLAGLLPHKYYVFLLKYSVIWLYTSSSYTAHNFQLEDYKMVCVVRSHKLNE